MKNTLLGKVSRVLDVAVFVFTTMAIAGVFYEGMSLKWYDIVGVLVVCMDYTFMPATILHLIMDRNDKWIALHIFSMVLIIAAVVMKVGGIPYPAITLLFWYFYLWFLYGSILIRRCISASE